MTTYCAVNLRCCVLALTNLRESLRRNFVVTCSSPTNLGMWFRHNLKASLHRNTWFSRRALRSALQLDLLVTVFEIR